MEIQDLLIDGIEFLESLSPTEENTTRIQSWRDQLNQTNATTPPKCPKGEYYNGHTCVADIGE